MQKLCQQIIQKFQLKQSDIKNYDYNSQNQEGSVKLQNAYDYFLQVAPLKQKNLLFTQFTKQLKKTFTNKQPTRDARKRYSDTKYGGIQSFVFILIRQENQEICTLRYPQQSQFFNFFYIWTYTYKQAELQFIRDFSTSFNIKLNQQQFSQREDKINFEKNEFSLVFVNLKSTQLNRTNIEEIQNKFQIDIETVKLNSQQLIDRKDFFILKNFLPYINQHFEIADKQNEDSNFIQTRQKANSDPPRPESLELSESDSDQEEQKSQHETSQKELRLNQRIQKFENSLDDILTKYGIKFQLQLYQINILFINKLKFEIIIFYLIIKITKIIIFQVFQSLHHINSFQNFLFFI